MFNGTVKRIMSGVIACLFAVNFVTAFLSERNSTVSERNIVVEFDNSISADEAAAAAKLLALDCLFGQDEETSRIQVGLSRNEGSPQLLMRMNDDFSHASANAGGLPLIARLLSDRCFQGESASIVTTNSDSKNRLLFAACPSPGNAAFSGKYMLFCDEEFSAAESQQLLEQLTLLQSFKNSACAVKIARDVDGFSLQYSVHAERLEKSMPPAVIDELTETAYEIRERLFKGHKTTYQFCDQSMTPIDGWLVSVPETVPFDTTISNKHVTVEFNNEFSASASKNLAFRLAQITSSRRPPLLRIRQSAGELHVWYRVGAFNEQLSELVTGMAAFLGREVASESPDIHALTMHVCDPEFREFTTFSVDEQNGDCRFIGGNQLYFGRDLSEETVDYVQADLQESGLITDSTTSMLRVTWTGSEYLVQWILTPAGVDQNTVANAEAAANQLASRSLTEIPFRFEICDISFSLLGDNVWTNHKR